MSRKRINYRPFATLAAILFLMLCFPKGAAEKMRHVAISSVAPPWQALAFLKNATLKLLMIPPPGSRAESLEQTSNELNTLRLENHTLRTQLKNIREWLLQEERIQDEVQKWKSLSQGAQDDAAMREFYLRRAIVLKQGLDLQLRALFAKVIYREPVSWSSFLWLNVGEYHNRALKKRIVAKNSPVVVGTSLVGVVEEVHEKKCRIRLITDAGCVPSVRAVRGKEQSTLFSEHLDGLLLGLKTRPDLFASPQEAQEIATRLTALKGHLQMPDQDQLLAKGELYGTSQAFWRARDTVLRGVGFNYDFADQEGPARDLRTGETVGDKKKPMPILRVGDLLMTTGMDGIFPAGLRVGIVSHIVPLREGACSFEIEAKAACPHLDQLSCMTVLPPLE